MTSIERRVRRHAARDECVDLPALRSACRSRCWRCGASTRCCLVPAPTMLTSAAAAALLAAVTALSAGIPAWRASRLDPVATLHME